MTAIKTITIHQIKTLNEFSWSEQPVRKRHIAFGSDSEKQQIVKETNILSLSKKNPPSAPCLSLKYSE